jgi:hypothetical protein
VTDVASLVALLANRLRAVTFEASGFKEGVVASNSYVNNVGDDGWLKTQDRDSKDFVYVPKYTKLSRAESKGGRTYFSVLDSAAKGRVVSLSDANVPKYIGVVAPQQTPAHAVVTYGKYTPGWISRARNGQALDQQMGVLQVGSTRVAVSMNSVWNGTFTPIPAGNYTVLLPDAPHKREMTEFYRRVAPTLKYDRVWFPIKYGDNSRYVHVGNLSDGCTTVLDLDRWADVHEALISHRGPGGSSVAQLLVQGTPERAR